MRMLITLLFISFGSFAQEDIERYKLYPTHNDSWFLKLDTSTGEVWIFDEERRLMIKVEHKLIDPRIQKKIGRYELIKTEKDSFHLLFDNINGKIHRLYWKCGASVTCLKVEE